MEIKWQSVGSFVVLVTALLISGCDVDGYVVEFAVKSCKDRGGVTELSVGVSMDGVRCMDGTFYSIFDGEVNEL